MQLSNDKVQDIRGILPGLNLLEEIFWWHLNQWYKSVADQAAVLLLPEITLVSYLHDTMRSIKFDSDYLKTSTFLFT